MFVPVPGYCLLSPYSAPTQSSPSLILAIPAVICHTIALIGVTCSNTGKRRGPDGRPWAGTGSVPTPKGKGCCAPPTRTFLIQWACSVLTRGAPQRPRPAWKSGESGEREKSSPLSSGSGGFTGGRSVDEGSALSEYCQERVKKGMLSFSLIRAVQ